MTLDDIRATVAAQKARRRCMTVHDVDHCSEAIKVANKYLRVYSGEGFVPNSYKWRAEIQYIQAVRMSESDPWIWSIGWTGAQRPNGKGSLIVIR